MQKMSLAKIVACLTLGICAQIPATAQTADSTQDQVEAKTLGSPVPVLVDDEDKYAITVRPVLRHHLMLPSPAPADPSQPRPKPKLRVAKEPQPNAVKTGTGIVYVCDPNVPTSTCNYLNTTVAGYYNNIFTNANANIYIQFGTTGLGGSSGYINLVKYTPYVTAMTNKAVKSSIQASALTEINTYATPAYATQNIMGISVALGTTLGFTGLSGINAAETAPCTPYTSGCYNEVITVANAASQASGGFSLYYDDQGGTETASQYDFYAVVQHETDEVLGTSSCISTQNSSGLTDECDGPVTGSNGIPSTVDLLRYSSPGKLALNTTPSTTAGQYYSFDGGVHYGIGGDGNLPKVYNTLDNGDDFSDYISSSPDCGTNQAVQDAEGCPGEDAGLTILNDGESEVTILNTDGFDIPEAVLTSPAPGSTLSGASATFTWSATPGAADYAITVGTTGVGSSNIYASPSGAAATSQAVTGLPTSGKIYVRVYSYVGSFWTSIDYTVTGGSSSSSPAISLSPAALTFASTTVGSTTAAQAVTVKNTGTAAATLTSETLTGTGGANFTISANTCTATLAVSATCTVSVEFKPAAAGALAASLSVADNATGTPQTVALAGTGVAAQTFTVSLTPATLTFASTNVGTTTAAQLVTIKNTGTGTVNLTSETITGASASSFLKSATTCGASLAASATCTVSVEFKPAAAGALAASLSVADNATGTPQTVALTGTGAGALTYSLSVTPNALTWGGTTPVGGTSGTVGTVTIKNTGTGAVTLNSETIAGANASSFLKSATTCTATLAAAASCSVSLQFKPTAAGTLTASLSIADNATGSPQSVTLTGTGAAATPTVTITPASIAFPNTVAGATSDAQVVTLANPGTVPVTLTSITFTGSNVTSFTQIDTCGATLAAGASCSLYVAFQPKSAAALSATLTVADNATGSPQKVTLTGTGTLSPSVKLSTASIAFPITTHGTSSEAQPVTLTNSGTATLNLTSIAVTGANPTDFEALSTCAATLAPAASCTVYVAFKPATAAAFTAKLTVTDNGAASPQSVILTGTGN